MSDIIVPSNSLLTAANLAGSSGKNERRERDFYSTPPEATQALINTGLLPKDVLIWEPACGAGMMTKVFQDNGYRVMATDISEGQDFLKMSLPHPNCNIVTNPPFNLSRAFISHCLKHKVPVFALLLKSQYWHAQTRVDLFDSHPPAYVLALTWRLDFCFGERGGAPIMECLWSVWIEGISDTRYRLLRRPLCQTL